MVNQERGALSFEIVEVSFSLRLLLSSHFSFFSFFPLSLVAPVHNVYVKSDVSCSSSYVCHERELNEFSFFKRAHTRARHGQ